MRSFRLIIDFARWACRMTIRASSVCLAVGFTAAAIVVGPAFAQVAPAVAHAENAPRPPQAANFRMENIQSKTREETSGLVIGAEPALAENWPSTFVFHSNGKGCTSTAVGRRVILSAAHCVANGGEAKVTTTNYDSLAVCEHHPSYEADRSFDYALCLLSADLPNLGEGFERISRNASLVQAGKLMLLGYGCTTSDGKKDFGRLYQQFADIAKPVPNTSYIHTIGGAAVCSGDSGGGAYWVRATGEITGVRLLVGVNSKGDNSEHSYIANTADDVFANWAKSWAEKRSVTICGLNPKEDNCRS